RSRWSKRRGPPLWHDAQSLRNTRRENGACLIVLLAGIALLLFHHPPRPDPFTDGAVHEVTADFASALASWITIGKPDHPGWTGQSGDPMPDTCRSTRPPPRCRRLI